MEKMPRIPRRFRIRRVEEETVRGAATESIFCLDSNIETELKLCWMFAPVEVVREPKRAAALLQADKRRLLEMLREPDSSAGLARRLGLPRQQVNYHLRELEAAGLVQFVEERRKGNCVERLVRATAASYLISPEAMGRLGCGCGHPGCLCPPPEEPVSAGDKLARAAARAIRAAADGSCASAPFEAEVRFADAASREEFERELPEAIAALVRKYEAAEGAAERYRFVAACWPVPEPERCTCCDGAGGSTAGAGKESV
jgi:DNA-binding transcriptional ArsR family regulator